MDRKTETYYANKRILVTGGLGFLGYHLNRAFWTSDAHVEVVHNVCKASCDLLDPKQCDEVFASVKPTHVFHLAGRNGGLNYNLAYPADVFRQNTVMGLNILESAMKHKVEKVMSVVTSCAYPDDPLWCATLLGSKVTATHGGYLDESLFFQGQPHPSVACHGYAKRNLQLASDFYHKQYGLDAVCVCPTTLYGPGDTFDPARTKVMGAMVKRFVDAARAGCRDVECWGTGNAFREFLYAEDCAKLLVRSMVNYHEHNLPLNLGSGQEHTMKDLANLVAAKAGYRGEILWNSEKPEGQKRKKLCTKKMEYVLPGSWKLLTPLSQGVEATVAHYKELTK